MIRVRKPEKIPKTLETNGRAENVKNCKAYDTNPRSYRNGSSQFTIKNGIYGHTAVKSALKNAQYGKCCFCEKDLKDEYGAVEHFRPQRGYRSTKKQTLKRPGYYWLRYEWSNLFFVCSKCNSSKGNLFPLLDESKRAKSHHADYRKEIPLLLDPGGHKDPQKHIKFKNQLPIGVTKYGKKTIEICRLDREALNEKRQTLIGNINARIIVLDSGNNCTNSAVNKAREFIKNSMQSDAEFSSAAINYVGKFNIEYG